MSLSSVKNAYLKSLGLKVPRHFLIRSSSNCTFSTDGNSRHTGDFPSDIEIPEEPTNCCMSGCANCVWIQYAEELMTIFRDGDDKRVREIVLSKVEDPNLKAYLKLELKCLGSKNNSDGSQ